MKRLAPLLAVLLLAGALYVLLGGGGPEVGPYDDPSILDPLDAGPLPGEGARAATGNGAGSVGDTPGGDLLREEPGETRAQPAEAVRLVGRVLDEGRHPVVGAEVSVRVGRRAVGSTTTDGEGRFELPVLARALRALVVAEAPDGRLGTGAVWTSGQAGGRVAVPPIVVRAVAQLRVRVVAGPERAPVGGATCVLARRSAGQPVVIGTHLTSPSGQLTVGGLPQGVVDVFAAAPGKGRGHTRLSLPLAAGAVAEVALAGERAIDVRVVDAATRRPVAGAEVLVGDRLSMPEPDGPGYLPPVGSVRTNASGRATIGGLGATDKVYVNARAPGYALAPWWQHAQQGVGPEQREVEVRLYPFRTVRFIVDAFAPETPPDGTALTLELNPQSARMAGPDTRAYLEGGMLVVGGIADQAVRGRVRAPDGVYADFVAPARVTDAGSVVFRRARDVVVRVLASTGELASDIPLRLQTVPPGPRPLTATTDERGLATFPAVGGSEATLHRARPDGRGMGAILAKLDLADGSEVYEVELLPTTNVRLRITAAGEALLPSEYGLSIAGRPVPPEEIVEDPAAGTLVAPFDNAGPRRTVAVRLTAEGYLAAERTLEVEEGDEEHQVDIDLQVAGRLLVRVRPPPDGQFTTALERRSDSGAWQPSGGRFEPGSGGGVRSYGGLESGTYRVRDARSGIRSEPALVVPGEEAAQVSLDLSSVGWVEGHVRAPAGADLLRARVIVEGKDRRASPWSGAAVAQDGSFRVRLGSDVASTVTVTHPVLRAAGRGGRVTVRGGASPIELRLEAGSEAHFTVAAATAAAEGLPGSATVRLYRGGFDGDPVLVVQPLVEGGRYRFGGYEPGAYALWMDFGSPYAPVVRKKVTLGEGATDLGSIPVETGSALRVRVRPGVTKAAMRLFVTAVSTTGPRYTRSASSREEGGDALCLGLGRGTFHVSVRTAGSFGGSAGGMVYEGDLTLDGGSELVLEVAP